MVNSSSAAQPTSAQFRIPQRHRPWRAAAGFLFAISLAGCGGGGDEGGGTPPPPSVLDAGTAYRNMLNSDHTWDLSGTGSDGVGVFLRYSTKVAVTAPYPPTGASGSRTELEMIRIIGPSGLVFVSSFYFNPADMALFGVARANGTCDTATSTVPVPANTQLGQSGAVAAFSTLQNCTGSTTVVGQRHAGLVGRGGRRGDPVLPPCSASRPCRRGSRYQSRLPRKQRCRRARHEGAGHHHAHRRQLRPDRQELLTLISQPLSGTPRCGNGETRPPARRGRLGLMLAARTSPRA